MPSMTKRVNVYAQVAVRNVTPPIYGTCKDIVMTTGDILKCLCKRARVEEILPDGKLVRLNMRNYYTDNGAGLNASKSVTKEAVKVENPARFKVPVAPKAQVVETKTVEEPKPLEETQTVADALVEENIIHAVIENEVAENAEAESANSDDNIMAADEEVSDDTNVNDVVECAECINTVDDDIDATEAEVASINTNNNQHHNHNHNHKKKHKK